jgi:hypothetical protein
MKSKLITFVMGLLLAVSVWADGGNSVYIDQTNADQSSVTITQTGSNNNVGDSNTTTGNPFVIDGNSMNLTITQDGMNNSILGNFIGGSSDATISQIGNSNSTVLNYGNFGTSSGTLGISFTGSNNNSILNIGTLHNSSNYLYNLDVTGDHNSITSTINSAYTTNNFTIAGDSNTFTTTQTGFGTLTGGGHNISANVIGDSNSISVLQDGNTIANSAVINLTGSNSAISITQH